ncbi:MAG: hypothetical protein A2087_10230 [Spirochaetes bacterium GWD1_61_31]|nr:MAG: hypothetical protein A2Y37_12285 [Spirochaetes bacterium GWB1_60_80]OHD30151.1 MAG: hypothetical protein A2004_14150 [Spirochaetes bacterium GWC1_61_12]OHD34594.1 MAG: hypothetical protein A2087_10230 [Spirochaetes bacterium GWD1_61_31]OHD46410.1 MAG: hypothetical protein A2Y35_10135 [Spirochaetes bacterium GWE1_60_18]OHD59466.1 MAG: hypothetical protein A2Y32_10090 [Spirochaetes bacterium GWF1_60_12]HAP43540.1 hypothetical protein [Spirochaetaceae bacterium]
MDKGEIQFEISRHIGVLGSARGGWTTELNLVSWNGREPKLDLRPWDPSHQRMGKGIALSAEEAKALHEVLGHYLSTTTN